MSQGTRQSWWLRWNSAANRFFYRTTHRPHHFELYKDRVRNAAVGAERIVHLGAGSLALDQICEMDLSGKTVFAVEPDADALAANPSPQKILASGESIPLPSGAIDMIVSEYVVEHLVDPDAVLREAHRLLRPGRRFIFLTPNLLSYSGFVTHVTPQWLHRRFLQRLLELGASANERPYPTAFRMNTLRAIRLRAAKAGFRIRELHTCVDHPTYTYPFPILHQLAVLWHVVLDQFELFAPFRITFVGVLERPASAASGASRDGA